MPYHSYTNTKKPILFDVYQVGIIKRVLDLVCIEGLFWVDKRPLAQKFGRPLSPTLLVGKHM